MGAPTIHPSAIVDIGAQLGDDTKVWHFSHVCAGARIGARCSLGQNVYVGNDVQIGDNVKIQNNVSVYDAVTLEDDVFCGPSMVFTNVYNPRAAVTRKSEYRRTLVRSGATLGANCTLVCGVTVGRYAFVICSRFGELPVLNLVYGDAPDAHGALLPEHCDRALIVLRVGKHRHAHRTQGARAPPNADHGTVLDLDVACEGCRICLHALDRTDQPVDQIDIMACLVHERAAVKFPRAAPFGAVVVLLRSAPEHIETDHVDAAKPFVFDGALEQLQRRVAAVLLDDEQANIS